MFLTVKMKSFLGVCALFCATSLLLSVIVIASSREPAEEAVSASEPVGKVLILDPGHGGLDGGAVGIDGTIESAVNLDIALKTRDLAVFFGKNTVMTREGEELDYPDEGASIAAKKVSDQKARVELINSFADAELISIHQNTYPSQKIHGAQVFHRADDESKAMAEKIQAALNTKLISSGRRVAAPVSGDIYLMKSINCPAVLVECGFLSNPDECARLADTNYRTKLAITILSTWLS